MYKFKTRPWLHQLRALDYMMVRDQAALYTDMGSGKTKVALDLINNKGFNKSLIVTTKQGCYVWAEEAKIHLYTDDFVIINLTDVSDKQHVLAESNMDGRPIILIVNYDIIWRDQLKQNLVDINLDCIICDESHKIKDPGTRRSKALFHLGSKVKYKYMLTGTPSTGKPIDVYSQYKFLDPNIFGTKISLFRQTYENLDPVRTAFAGFRVLDKNNPYKNLEQLKEKMYSCAFRCTPDLKLPATTDIIRTFIPSKKSVKFYKELAKTGVIISEDGIVDTKTALTKVLRLQQVLSGYVPMQDMSFQETTVNKIDDSRIQVLKELIEGIGSEHKIVVFARFIYDFETIETLCKELNITYGEVSGKRNDYKEWKQGSINLIAVNYQSGSESISLVEARYCIYYTLYHSYAMYAQSRKRIHRPGQTNPVTYYHVVAQIPNVEESIDQSIMEALKEKKDIVDYLLDKERRFT